MRSICTKQIVISLAMLTSLGAAATAAQAQEVARVVSLTPNIRQVQTPKLVCTFDAYKNQTCSNQVITQNVNDGYNVVYEYEGRLFTVFSATDPGPYIQLNAAQHGYVPPTTTYVQPAPVYNSGYAPAYAPGYAHSAFPVPAPIIVRPSGFVHGYVPRPVVVVRGGGYYGGHHGGHHGFSRGHHGGRGHYR